MQLRPQIFRLSQKREELEVDWYFTSDSPQHPTPVVWQCVGDIVQSSLALGTYLCSVFVFVFVFLSIS